MSQLHASRQQLQRLGVVVAWSAKARAVAECRRVMQAAAVHAAALQDAADQLAYLHSELTATAAPAYDIATAVQVTEQGAHWGVEPCGGLECRTNAACLVGSMRQSRCTGHRANGQPWRGACCLYSCRAA